jgi:hypothetical protein
MRKKTKLKITRELAATKCKLPRSPTVREGLHLGERLASGMSTQEE